MRVLIAEDEKNLNRILSKKLKSDGYSVDSCFDGAEAWDHIEMAEYDLIILDVMMPEMDGFEVLRRIRQNGISSSVLMLTAKDAVEYRVAGLDGGADDYLTKPFAFEELMARVRVLTRKRSGNATNVFKVSDLEMDDNAHKVTRAGKEISLSAKEYAMLKYFIMNKDIVLSRERLENHLWSYDYEGASNMVDVYISYLRKKIDSDAETKLLHTVRGSGYVLREEG